jgi:pimeloyl-ACP methyl ester carboxylesterase
MRNKPVAVVAASLRQRTASRRPRTAICWSIGRNSRRILAADLPAAAAQFMAISQVPLNGSILGTPITAPAWKTKPSYGIVATQDRMINPDLERSMYKRAGAKVTEIKGSHAIFLSQPRAVANVIEQAARSAR